MFIAVLLGAMVFTMLTGITAPALFTDMVFARGSSVKSVARVVVPILSLIVSILVGRGVWRMTTRKQVGTTTECTISTDRPPNGDS